MIAPRSFRKAIRWLRAKAYEPFVKSRAATFAKADHQLDNGGHGCGDYRLTHRRGVVHEGLSRIGWPTSAMGPEAAAYDQSHTSAHASFRGAAYRQFQLDRLV